MQKYINNIQDLNGNAVLGALITVNILGGIAAVIYSDNGITTQLNPISSDIAGRFSFYAADGRYSLSITYTGNVVVVTDILLQDPATDLSPATGASLVGVTPAGGITSNTVAAALNELDTKKTALLTLSASSGSALVGNSAIGTGAVTRTVQSKLREVVSIKDFGAVGDGVANDEVAMTSWLALAGTGVTLYAPAGKYLFTSAKVIAAVSNIRIRGDGRQKTKFIYSGAGTTSDLWTIGDGTTSFTGMNIEGFNIDSTTAMTAGTALRIKFQQNGSSVKDVSFSNLNFAQFLWDGIWFDNTNVTDYIGFEVNVKNEGVIVSGSATLDTGSDLYLDQGTVLNSNVGIHCAGGFGGLYVGKVLCYGNLTNYLVDNARIARYNRELLYSTFAISDGCKNYGFYINDTLANGANITLNAFIGSAGRVGTGGVGINIKVAAFPNSRITIGSSQIFNATSDGINISDASTLITIGANTQINNNTGLAINSTVTTNNVSFACDFFANGGGNVSGNIRKSFTPAITSQTGTLTTATGSMYWSRSGAIVFISVLINITNNGTGATAISCTLPFTGRSASLISGRAISISGKMLQGLISTNGTTINITNYDATYPGATGETFQISGSYEAY